VVNIRVLVTGSAGFIGSNLVKKLIDEGNYVVGIDKDLKKKKLLENLLEIELNPKMYKVEEVNDSFKMIWDNINNIRAHTYELKEIDIVYHLAASADIRKSFKHPTMDLDNNVMGTSEVLEFMRISNIKNLIFSSSSSIYGEINETPTPESVGNIKPISLYGASKLSNEAFINAYSHLYGIKAWMFRFANVVGRNMHRGVIHDFVERLEKNPKKLDILGDGNQEKSFFDVDDCIRGLLEIPNNDANNGTEVYNLGNYYTMYVKDLADIVCDEMNIYPEYNFTGGDRGWKGDTPYTILSIEKALDRGWKPKYDCEEAIRRTVRWLRRDK